MLQRYSLLQHSKGLSLLLTCIYIEQKNISLNIIVSLWQKMFIYHYVILNLKKKLYKKNVRGNLNSIP